MIDNYATLIAFLANDPAPEQILALRPSPELQARATELLARNKIGMLSHEEESELDQILQLEHLARMAKAHAFQQQAGN